MAKDPIFPLFYNDIDRSTRDWTDEEFGAYMRLLMHQWDKSGLPLGFDRLSRIAPSVEKNWPVLSTKFAEVDGQLKNPRLEEIRAERLIFRQRQADNGKKGGRPKNPTITQTQTQPITQTDPEKKPLEVEVEEEVNKDLGKPENPLPTPTGNIRQPIIQAMTDCWRTLKPDYPFDVYTDGNALFEIGEFISGLLKIKWIPLSDDHYDKTLEEWNALANWVAGDEFYKSFSLAYLSKTKTLQTVWQKSKQTKDATGTPKVGAKGGRSAGARQLLDNLKANIRANTGGEQGSRAQA